MIENGSLAEGERGGDMVKSIEKKKKTILMKKNYLPHK